MNQADTAAKGAPAIAPISQAPEAFSVLAAKINEIIAALNAAGDVRLVVAPPLKLVTADAGPPVLSLDIAALAKMLRLEPNGQAAGGASGGGSGSVPAGYREQVVSLCEGSFSTNMTFLVKI